MLDGLDEQFRVLDICTSELRHQLRTRIEQGQLNGAFSSNNNNKNNNNNNNNSSETSVSAEWCAHLIFTMRCILDDLQKTLPIQQAPSSSSSPSAHRPSISVGTIITPPHVNRSSISGLTTYSHVSPRSKLDEFDNNNNNNTSENDIERENRERLKKEERLMDAALSRKQSVEDLKVALNSNSGSLNSLHRPSITSPSSHIPLPFQDIAALERKMIFIRQQNSNNDNNNNNNNNNPFISVPPVLHVNPYLNSNDRVILQKNDEELLHGHFNRLMNESNSIGALHPFGASLMSFTTSLENMLNNLPTSHATPQFLSTLSAPLRVFLTHQYALLTLGYPGLCDTQYARVLARSCIRKHVADAAWSIYKRVLSPSDANFDVMAENVRDLSILNFGVTGPLALGLDLTFDNMSHSLANSVARTPSPTGSNTPVSASESSPPQPTQEPFSPSSPFSSGAVQPAYAEPLRMQSAPPKQRSISILSPADYAQGGINRGRSASLDKLAENKNINSDDGADPTAYHKSIQVLSKLATAKSVEEKLDTLVYTCRMISKEFDEYIKRIDPVGSASLMTRLALTSDDLFPVLAYCLVKARIPYLYSTTAFLADFIDEDEQLGERGYCLTTFQCVVNMLPNLIDQSNQATRDRISISTNPDDLISPLPSPCKPLPMGFNHGSPTSSGARKLHPSRYDPHSPHLSPSTPSSTVPNVKLSQNGVSWSALCSEAVALMCRFCDYQSMDSGWTRVYLTNDIDVLRKQVTGNPVHCIKGRGIIRKPITTVVGYLLELSNRKDYDEMYDTGTIVELVDQRTKIVHMKFKARNWCQRHRRDFCILWHTTALPGGVHVILGKSVEHPLCPPDPKYTRGNVFISGWLLRPCNQGQFCEATYLVNVNLGGLIPAWLINAVHTKQPMVIKNLRELLE